MHTTTRKNISLLGLMGLGLTAVIGSGVWKDSLLWANFAGIFSLPAVIIGWTLMLTVGLSYAECIGMFPQGGGPYSYVQGAFGRKAGVFVGLLFLLGYVFIAAILSFLTAVFALAALSHPGYALLTSTNLILTTSLIIVVLVIGVSLLSSQQLGRVALLWVAVKIILVISVFSLLFVNWTTPSWTVPSLEGLQSAVNSSIWALFGFEVMLVYVTDIEDPASTVPKAILWVLPIFLIVYLIVTVAAAGVVSVGSISPEDASSSISLIGLLASTTGLSGNLIFAFASFSAAGTAYALLATLMKQTMRLAEDNALPTRLAHRNYATGIVAIAMLVATILMIFLSDSISSIVDVFAATGMGLVLFSTMLPAGLTALVLRIRMPALNRPFKTPLYIIVYPLAVILALYLLYLNYSSMFSILLSLLVAACALILVVVFSRRQTT